jgi:broad specificity phosphatase PhoE
MTTKLILIRHGESESNIEGRFNRTAKGTNLTEEGKRQSELVANRLKDKKIDILYTSPTNRTLQTTEIINKYLNLEVNIEEDLKERDYGILSGQPRKNIKLPDNLREINVKRVTEEDFKIPQGESFTELKERVIKIINKIIEKHKNKTILIIAHGNVVRSLVAELFKMSLKETYKILRFPSNTCYTEIDINGEPKLIEVFSDEHLEKS